MYGRRSYDLKPHLCKPEQPRCKEYMEHLYMDYDSVKHCWCCRAITSAAVCRYCGRPTTKVKL